VDMLFKEFYTGSETDLSDEERHRLEELFTTQFYVQVMILKTYMRISILFLSPFVYLKYPTRKVSHDQAKNYTVVVRRDFTLNICHITKPNYVHIYFSLKCPIKSHNLPILLFTLNIAQNTVIFLAGL